MFAGLAYKREKKERKKGKREKQIDVEVFAKLLDKHGLSIYYLFSINYEKFSSTSLMNKMLHQSMRHDSNKILFNYF